MSKPTKVEMRAAIKRAHGIIRRNPGDKPFAQWWAEHKAGEKALEERKLARFWRQRPPNLADRP